ncbi:MAG: hypothetical protein HYR90_02155 [Candidatus Andersenbacteria bacterium]|nr:hypothetical protein [Candidatus Andersenbacteria bacterium]MBI3250964.1 hypothetical protein [Candidatus Andersenbacteria bacterium]
MREINLLPTPRRTFLRRQWIYDSLRRFVFNINVALIIMTAVALATLAGLRSVSFFTSADAESTIPEYLGKYQATKQAIEEKNRLIAQASAADQGRIIWGDYITELLNVLPPGTLVERITADADQEEIMVTGDTVNRSSLTLLDARIKSLSWAKEVRAPLTNLLDRENPEFSFTIILNRNAAEP